MILAVRSLYCSFREQNDNNKHNLNQSDEVLKLELQHLQQKLDKIDMSYYLQWCIIIIGGASE